MLKYALDHQDAITVVTQSRGLDLHKFELTDVEWEIAQQLCDILKDTTTFFSRSTPNLATVISAMDLIHETLTSYSGNQKYCASIRAAVRLAKKTLNRYYELTDKSKVYRIAIVLHPRLKLSYFKSTGWTEEWIDTAETLVREEFEHSYSILDIENNTDIEVDEEPAGSMDVDSSMVRSISLFFHLLMSCFS
ncbi:uncharacterized protein F5891DRAFT_944607 [Suillus fuscotomentosus]|uniref:hAT-like transposase RNase-H fold domain-containing protein n=1 Tax=Suillus fuscotomentosus TaxID=1912939 RepID=A0AAD4EEU1_9AGAM|nr:uncharacterized protein F5891DRAFT_944607 [Suillus fuscotomentosus]KAG1904943.1 hypothetical protein F5891DRAFT_944607 [Suillus fuscotomentosus]